MSRLAGIDSTRLRRWGRKILRSGWRYWLAVLAFVVLMATLGAFLGLLGRDDTTNLYDHVSLGMRHMRRGEAVAPPDWELRHLAEEQDLVCQRLLKGVPTIAVHTHILPGSSHHINVRKRMRLMRLEAPWAQFVGFVTYEEIYPKPVSIFDEVYKHWDVVLLGLARNEHDPSAHIRAFQFLQTCTNTRDSISIALRETAVVHWVNLRSLTESLQNQTQPIVWGAYAGLTKRTSGILRFGVYGLNGTARRKFIAMWETRVCTLRSVYAMLGLWGSGEVRALHDSRILYRSESENVCAPRLGCDCGDWVVSIVESFESAEAIQHVMRSECGESVGDLAILSDTPIGNAVRGPNRPEVFRVPPGLCQSLPLMVSMVESSISDFQFRDQLRQDYILQADSSFMRLVFVLGRPETKAEEGRVLAEVYRHKDIIIGNFVDSYANLASKTAFLMSYFSSCNNTRWKFLLKHDSDVVVNYRGVQRYINGLQTLGIGLKHGLLGGKVPDQQGEKEPVETFENSPLYVGHSFESGIMEIIHIPSHRNFENTTMSYYPAYNSGPSYMVNKHFATAVKLYFDNEKVKAFKNEDAMMGQIAFNASIPVYNNLAFIIFPYVSTLERVCGATKPETLFDCDCRSWLTYCRWNIDGEIAEYTRDSCDWSVEWPFENYPPMEMMVRKDTLLHMNGSLPTRDPSNELIYNSVVPNDPPVVVAQEKHFRSFAKITM